MTGPADDAVLLVIPPDAWLTLSETLELDSESAAFDRELRRGIRDALDAVVECDNKVHVVLTVLSGVVDEVGVYTDEASAEAALVEWLRGQPGIPDDLTAQRWWAMKEMGEVPQSLEDATLYEVPLSVTIPEEDAT